MMVARFSKWPEATMHSRWISHNPAIHTVTPEFSAKDIQLREIGG